MRIVANRDRLWLLGGLIVAVLLVVVAWEFFISSQKDKTTSVKNEVASAQQQVLDSTHQLNQLKADNANLDKYKAALTADQQALPTDTAMADFLRELHNASDATSVGIAQLQVGEPQPIAATAGAAGTYQVTVSMVATGPTDNLVAFMKQLQSVQPRAVLFTSVAIAAGANSNAENLNTSFEVFLAPVAGTVPSGS